MAVGMRKRVVVRLPAGVALVDPDPEETARRDVELLDGWKDDATAVIGWSSGGWDALELAARNADAVERLVLVATPRPDDDVDWLDGVLRRRFSSTRRRIRRRDRRTRAGGSDVSRPHVLR